jgi:hypothetical protein
MVWILGLSDWVVLGMGIMLGIGFSDAESRRARKDSVLRLSGLGWVCHLAFSRRSLHLVSCSPFSGTDVEIWLFF